MSDNDNNGLAGALFLIAGGILGAGLALLFAPQSGRETREGLAKMAKRAKSRTDEVVEDFSENVTQVVDTVTETAEDILTRGKDLAYETKKEILKALEKGQEALDTQRKRLSDLIG
jgi:gas vesicle protein